MERSLQRIRHTHGTLREDLPEQPQKPVIDLLEDAGHVAKGSIAI